MSTNLEVETKIKISEKNVNSIRNKIKSLAEFSKKETKTDVYYSHKNKNYPKKAFRIRSNGKNYVVNFKNWMRHLYSIDIVVKKEHEFTLNTKDQVDNFLALMEDLGFKKWMQKTKITETYRYKKEKKLSIELSNVKKLGWFIELEYLCQENEVQKAKSTIREAIKKLSINPNQIDNTGYTKMLFNHK